MRVKLFSKHPQFPRSLLMNSAKTPETSKDTPKQEDQEEIKVTKIEALTDEKRVDDVEAVSTQTEREVETIGNEYKNDGKAVQIDEETQEKEQALNTLEKDQVADSIRMKCLESSSRNTYQMMLKRQSVFNFSNFQLH
nr:hypothetical protein [Tanacetum cinerariifolium]